MKWFHLLLVLLISLVVCQKDSINKRTPNNSTLPEPSTQCLDAKQCDEIDMKTCNCEANQLCAQTERTCLTCPKLICIDAKPENSENSTVPIIAGSIVAAVILLLVIGVFAFYYRNRNEVTARGGLLGYIKHRAHRDSINKSNLENNGLLLSERNSVIDSKRSSMASMFMTVRPKNINSIQVKPRVLVMEEKRNSDFLPSESGIYSQNLNSARSSVLFRNRSVKSAYQDNPLPPPVSNETEPQPIMEGGLLGSLRLSDIFAKASGDPPKPAQDSHLSAWPIVEFPEVDSRPTSFNSFTTQILSNPLAEAELYASTNSHLESDSTPLPPPPAVQYSGRQSPLSDIIVTQFP